MVMREPIYHSQSKTIVHGLHYAILFLQVQNAHMKMTLITARGRQFIYISSSAYELLAPREVHHDAGEALHTLREAHQALEEACVATTLPCGRGGCSMCNQ